MIIYIQYFFSSFLKLGYCQNAKPVLYSQKKGEKMANKKYDLKQILSNEAYNDVYSYLAQKLANGEQNDFFGVDAFAMVGLTGYKSVGISKIVQMLQNLADPSFVNLRSDWGDSYNADNKLTPNVSTYANGKRNAFAVQSGAQNFSYLQMPLENNKMGISGSFKNVPLQSTWSVQKSNLEKALGIQIIEDANLEVALDKKQAKTNDDVTLIKKDVKLTQKAKNVVKKLTSPAVLIKNKVTGTKPDVLAKDSLRVDNRFATCLVSRTFREQELSDAEKFLAVVDAVSHESVKNFIKNDKEIKTILKGVDDQSKRKILFASQVTADMFASLASDLGTENHKQIENALKLQIAGTLGSLEDQSYRATRAYAQVSNRLTNALLTQLGLNAKTIVENRAKMGVNYVDEFPKDEQNNTVYNLEQVMFGRTINKAFKLENNVAKFVGQSPAFDELQPFAEEVLGLTPPLRPAPAVSPAPQPAPVASTQPAPVVTPQPTPVSNPQPQPVAQPVPAPVQTAPVSAKPAPRTIKDDGLVFDYVNGVVSQKSDEQTKDFDIADYDAFQGSSSYIISGKPTNVNKTAKPAPQPAPTVTPAPTSSSKPSSAPATSPAKTPNKTQLLQFFALYLPKRFVSAINEKNFESEESQEYLKCIHTAMQNGEVVIEPRPYSQKAVKDGIKVKPANMFNYCATSEEALYKVSRKLSEIEWKYNKRLLQQKKQLKNNTDKSQKKTTSKKPSKVTQQKSTPVVDETKKFMQDFANVQEYFGYENSKNTPYSKSLRFVADHAEYLEIGDKVGGIDWIDNEPEVLEDGEKIVDWINQGEPNHVNDDVTPKTMGVEDIVDKTLQNNAQELSFVSKHVEYNNFENSKDAEFDKDLTFVADHSDFLAQEKEKNEQTKKIVGSLLVQKASKNANALKNAIENRQSLIVNDLAEFNDGALSGKFGSFDEANQALVSSQQQTIQTNQDQKMMFVDGHWLPVNSQPQTTASTQTKTAEDVFFLQLPTAYYKAQIKDDHSNPMVEELEYVLADGLLKGHIIEKPSLVDKSLSIYYTKNSKRYFDYKNQIEAICGKYGIEVNPAHQQKLKNITAVPQPQSQTDEQLQQIAQEKAKLAKGAISAKVLKEVIDTNQTKAKEIPAETEKEPIKKGPTLAELISKTQVARKEELYSKSQKPKKPRKYLLAMPESYYREEEKNNFKSTQMQKMLKVLYYGIETKEIFIEELDNNKLAYFANNKETAKKYNVLLNQIYWHHEYREIKNQKLKEKEANKENAKQLQFVVDFEEYLKDQNQGLENAKHLAFVVDFAEHLAEEKASKRQKEEQEEKAKIEKAQQEAKQLKDQLEKNNQQPKTKKRRVVGRKSPCPKSSKLTMVVKDEHIMFV